MGISVVFYFEAGHCGPLTEVLRFVSKIACVLECEHLEQSD